MKDDNLNKIISDISILSKKNCFFEAYSLYDNVSHPVVCYLLGVNACNIDEYVIAKKKLIEASMFGFEYPNEYSSNLYSNSIGQSIYMLLKEELIEVIDYQKTITLLGLAFNYLTVSINLIGNKAYQSYETRANLFTISKYENESAAIMNMLGVEDIGFPLTIANDYYQSFLGYSTFKYFGENSHTEELRVKGLNALINVENKFSGDVSLDYLTQAASVLSKTAYNNSAQILKYANAMEKDWFFS